MKIFGRRLRLRRSEEGAVAILMAVLCILIFMFAAFSVDIAMQINRKHQLWGTLDAAAQAGASKLPLDTAGAQQAAFNAALARDASETGTLKPNVDFWCVVGATGTAAPYAVDQTQIPSTCNPKPAGMTWTYTVNANFGTTGRKISCSSKLCAIPCVVPSPNSGTPKVACNTIRVYQGRAVPFQFAPTGGIDYGHTGSLVSVACKGPCGTVPPNPLDVAVVADRTSSMGNTDIDKLVAGIKGMLQQMTPSQQYVSLGTIGRSGQTTTAQAASKACNSTARGLTFGSSSGTTGLWMPIAFSNNYQTSPGNLDASSTLVKGVECLTNQSAAAQGTVLASALKAAARYLLGNDPNNISSLTPARTEAAKKILIFETDGQPNERGTTGGSTSLGNAGDIFSDPMDTTTSTTNNDTSEKVSTSTTITTTVTHNKTVTYTYSAGNKACQNLIDVAANARAAGITVIMIGYNMSSKQCYDYDGIKDDYSNLCDTQNPEVCNVSSSSTSAAVAGPESQTSAKCPAPNQAKTCVTKYQTITTTKYQKGPASSPSVLNVMAQAASPVSNSDGSTTTTTAQSDCSDATERTAENSDGDYLFCAASGTDMAPIFKTALGQASTGIKLLNLP